MKPFKVLIVEDNENWAEALRDNLETISLAELAGEEYDRFEFTVVTNQADADQAVAAPSEYDLVLLDLWYPLTPDSPLSEDEQTEFQGLTWLPKVRRLQPNATIVILTAHAEQSHLRNAVSAIRDQHANDFIPKTTPFDEVEARIRIAIENARHTQQMIRLEEELRQLLRTPAARTYAEDVAALLNQTKAALYRVAQRLESGDASAVAVAPQEIRSEFDYLTRRFVELTDLLTVGQDAQGEVDVADLVRQMALLHERMIDNVCAETIKPDAALSIKLTTIEGDLKAALTEIITNALDALERSKKPAKKRKFIFAVEAIEGDAVIRVIDNGDGFSDEAMARMYERGYTSKNGSHQGMGLYIAKRMMHHIGGEIWAGNRPEGGAEVRLMVRDLRRP
jgi:signal transduction histidine kinase